MNKSAGAYAFRAIVLKSRGFSDVCALLCQMLMAMFVVALIDSSTAKGADANSEPKKADVSGASARVAKLGYCMLPNTCENIGQGLGEGTGLLIDQWASIAEDHVSPIGAYGRLLLGKSSNQDWHKVCQYVPLDPRLFPECSIADHVAATPYSYDPLLNAIALIDLQSRTERTLSLIKSAKEARKMNSDIHTFSRALLETISLQLVNEEDVDFFANSCQGRQAVFSSLMQDHSQGRGHMGIEWGAIRSAGELQKTALACGNLGNYTYATSVIDLAIKDLLDE